MTSKHDFKAALWALNRGYIDNVDPNGDHLEAVETALRIADRLQGGDDWFDIESAPKDGTIILTKDNRKKLNVSYWSKIGQHEPPAWIGGHCRVNHIDQPIHWKHIDGQKHIEMMMERELSDER